MAWHYGTWRHTRGSCAPDSTRAGRRLGSRRGTRHQTATACARTRIVRLFVTRKSYEAEFFLLNFFLLTSHVLVRTRRPAADTERSEHDFHCQRAKDESHYTDKDGRALPADHPQNRIRKKQEDVGNEEHHQKDNAGFEPLRHRINIVI